MIFLGTYFRIKRQALFPAFNPTIGAMNIFQNVKMTLIIM